MPTEDVDALPFELPRRESFCSETSRAVRLDSSNYRGATQRSLNPDAADRCEEIIR